MGEGFCNVLGLTARQEQRERGSIGKVGSAQVFALATTALVRDITCT